MAQGTRLTLFGQDASAVNALVLNSEEDAWNLLADLRREDFIPPDDILLGDWCQLHLHLVGDKWNSTITPSIFPVFHNLQRIVYHAYAQAQYGDKKRRLSKEEKENLEIVIHIAGGSSNITSGSSEEGGKPNLAAIALAIGKACVDKMSSKHILIAIIVITLAVAGTSAYQAYVEKEKNTRLAELQNDERKDDRRAILEAMHFADEEDKQKANLLKDAARHHEVLGAIEDDIDDFHHSLLKAATKAKDSTIQGVVLEEHVAKEIVKSNREKPVPMQINGLFQVVNLDWNFPNEITLRRVSDNTLVRATFDLAWLPAESKHVIQAAEWKENGDKVFHAHINARIASDGRIVNAELVRVAPAGDNDGNAPRKH